MIVLSQKLTGLIWLTTKLGLLMFFKGYIYILNGCSETDILQLLEIIWLNMRITKTKISLVVKIHLLCSSLFYVEPFLFIAVFFGASGGNSREQTTYLFLLLFHVFFVMWFGAICILCMHVLIDLFVGLILVNLYWTKRSRHRLFKMGKFRHRMKGSKGKRWAKGHSSSSNPSTSNHREAAKSRFFQDNLGKRVMIFY